MTLDVEGKPEENCPNHILENYDFGSMPDEKFHRLMNMNDLSYSALFADKVFENTVWNEYEDKEILNVRSISSSEENLQTTFYWFLPCRGLLPVSLFCIRFPGFLIPRCALLFWGIFVRGLRVETFVRVLRSSELSLNNCK